MDINVGDHIAEVLFDKDTVSIPGLGVFATQYKVARLDRAAGKWLPPSKELQFERSSERNDGFLIKYIKDKHNISYADAQQVVIEYVDELKSSIEQEEIVALPNVGRLYKNYASELVFLPDRENFSKASFGLPAVDQILPLNETATVEAPTKKIPQTKQKEKTQSAGIPVKEPAPTLKRQHIVSISAIAITLLAIAGYFVYTNIYLPNQANEKYINTSPSRAQSDLPPIEKETFDAPEITFEQSEDPVDPSAKSAIEALEEKLPKVPTFLAIVSIGTFDKVIEADRMILSLQREGFKSFGKKVKGKTVVAVEVGYDREAELDTVLTKLQQKVLTDDVKVIEKRTNDDTY